MPVELPGIAPIGVPALPVASQEGPRQAFADTVRRLVSTVESSGAEANAAVARMLDGTGEVHEAMIALQQADMALQLTVQVRNKIVQAYQDIMRMPV